MSHLRDKPNQTGGNKMKRPKLILFLALAILAYASADATTRKSGERIQVVIRGEDGGPWRAYVFGARCSGMLTVERTGGDDPVVIVCR